MITRLRLLRAAGLIAAGLALFLAFLYMFIPSARINAIINQALTARGLSLSPGARKTLLPGLVWNKPQLSSDLGVLVRCDQLKMQLSLLPLVTGLVNLDVTALIGTGHLSLNYGITGRQVLDLHADDISLANIPFFKTVLGATAGGSLWSEGNVRRGPNGLNGHLKLEIKQLEYSGMKLGAFPLPDVANLGSQGMVKITDGKARLESFTLKGEGIYMRLSGDIPTGENAVTAPLNLTLEIMPKADFMEKQKLVFMLLAKFMASPGVYRIPVKGTMLKPEIL